MELNINSPAYFKDLYGVDDEVYNFFQKAYKFFLDKEYSDTLQIVGIAPFAVPQEILNSGEWKESIRLINNKSCAIVAVKIDFDEYYNADGKRRIVLIKKAILKSVKKINAKTTFDYQKFKTDLTQLSVD